MSESFTVEYSGTTTLSVDEVWPDGDGPENPTTEDVVEKMKWYGKFSTLDDWMLSEDIEVSVNGTRVW